MASSKRERELARQRAARQAARRAERERRRRWRNAVVASAVVTVLVLVGVAAAVVSSRGGQKDTLAAPAPTGSAAPSPNPSAAPSGTCDYKPGGSPARPVQPPPAQADTTAPTAADINTDQGVIPITLRPAEAPCTVNSFASLAKAGYFKDTPCHRLTDTGIFVLQCGDPSGTGRGGPGYTFGDENLRGATYPRGTVAMANSGPNTNGSQFFLVYKDSQLPPQYTPFGTITPAGLAVLDKIAAAGAQPPDATGNTAPKTKVTISDVVVKPAG